MSHETLTGHPMQEVPAYRNPFQPETNSVCMQEAQSAWAPRHQSGDSISMQMTQNAGVSTNESKCGGYPSANWVGKPDFPQFSGLPSFELDGLDSNMGPFDPHQENYGKLPPLNNFNKPHFNDGGKCGGADGATSHTSQRRMTEGERRIEQKLIEQKLIEQKIIEQKLREMKLRERFGF